MDTEKARLGPEAVGAGKARPGSLGGEGGAGKPVVLCEAHAFTDPEMGALEKAGGLGMLGHRFYRQTTVNWCSPAVGDSRERHLRTAAASSTDACPASLHCYVTEQAPSDILNT